MGIIEKIDRRSTLHTKLSKTYIYINEIYLTRQSEIGNGLRIQMLRHMYGCMEKMIKERERGSSFWSSKFLYVGQSWQYDTHGRLHRNITEHQIVVQ